MSNEEPEEESDDDINDTVINLSVEKEIKQSYIDHAMSK